MPGLILALDVESEERAVEIARATSEYVEMFKVGYPLVLASGMEIFSRLKALGKPVIADFKVADIPYTSARICKLARNAGADYVIVHGFVGEDVVKACSEVVKIFVVAEMSHPGATQFMQAVSEEIAEIANKYASGIVAPATRPERIRKLRKIARDLIIISPGVKAQGAEVGSAIRAGADYEIVGRAIYQSPNPEEEAKKIAEVIKKI